MRILIRLLFIALYSTGLAAQSGSDRLDEYFAEEFSELILAIEPHIEQLDLCLEQLGQYEAEIDFLDTSGSVQFSECLKADAKQSEIQALFINIQPVTEAYGEWLDSFGSIETFERNDFRSPALAIEAEALATIYITKSKQATAHDDRIANQYSEIAARIETGVLTPEEFLNLQKTVTEFSAYQSDTEDVLGCYVDFNIAGQDSVYAAGSVVSISGSIGFNYFVESQGLAMSLSVQGKDFELNAAQPPLFDISYAYLKVGDSSTADSEIIKEECEDFAGSFCSVWIEPVESIAGGVFSGDMQLIYQREIDGSEVAIGLNPSLMDEPEEPFIAWTACMLNLAESI